MSWSRLFYPLWESGWSFPLMFVVNILFFSILFESISIISFASRVHFFVVWFGRGGLLINSWKMILNGLWLHSTSFPCFFLLSIFIIFESRMHSMKGKFIIPFSLRHSNESKTIMYMYNVYYHFEEWKWKPHHLNYLCYFSYFDLHERTSFWLPIPNQATFTYHNQMKWKWSFETTNEWCLHSASASGYKDLLDKIEQFHKANIM